MKKYIILLLLLPVTVFAESYDDHYEKNSPSGADFMHWEERSGNVNIGDYYEATSDNVTIPGGVDNPTNEKNEGYFLGNSVKGTVGNEKGLMGLLKNMQSGGDIETLSETYICPMDNITYGDKAECTKNCMSVCDIYKFNTKISCQNAKEVLKISPDHIGANPPLSIKYQDKIYHTQKIDAVCGNGFMSNGIAYEWSFTKNGLNFVVPDSNRTLGECRDMKGKALMGAFNEYYEPITYALKAHLSKLGYVPSSTINTGDLSLSITVIVAGACDENSLKTQLPNEGAIDQMREGKLDLSQAQAIAQSDPNYSYITDNTDIKVKSCTISNKVSLYSDIKSAIVIDKFEGALPDITARNSGSTNVYNWGTTIGISQKNSYQEDFSDKISGTFISSSLDIGTFTNSNGGFYTGCPGNPLANGSTCQIENRWIESPVPYIFSVTVEKSTTEDKFSIVQNDTCESVSKGCTLKSESICDMYGGNCIEITKDGSSTGNKPKTFCSEISTSIDTYMVCSDGKNITAKGNKHNFGNIAGYFTIKRDYACESKDNSKYDYSSFLDQDKSISDTINVTDGGSVTFTGLDENGKPINFKTDVTLDKTTCQMTCKIRSQSKKEQPIINSDGKTIIPNTIVQDGVSIQLPVTSYKACEKSKSGDKWKCELDKGETLVSDCECQDDFMDMIIQMKLVTESSKDTKCSSK